MMSKSITKKKINDTIKRTLLSSLQMNDDVEEQGLNKTANSVNNFQVAILIICATRALSKHKIRKQYGVLVSKGNI